MTLDLNKLENKLDEALSNETSETLSKFLNDKRMTNNKQQTAVQEHIAWLKEQLQECIDQGYSESWISAYKLSIKHAELMLEEERVKAINLYYQYEKYAMITESVIMTFGQFYKQTYGGDKQ